MSISRKLRLLITIPILLLVGGFGYLSVNDYSEYSNLKTFRDSVVVSTDVNQLVHFLQQERGASAGYLGSKGTKFRVKLNTIRTNTDKRFQELKNDVNLVDHFTQRMQNQLKEVLSMYRELDYNRNKIDSLEWKTSDAVKYFSTMNAEFLKFVKMSSELSYDNSLTKQLQTITALSASKETAGKERAVMTGVFGHGIFKDGVYAKFITLVTLQKNNLSDFSFLAGPDAKVVFDDFIRSQSYKSVNKMREIAVNKATEGNFGVNSVIWFETITKKLMN